jgi:phytoene dehydrogenase-like protein
MARHAVRARHCIPPDRRSGGNVDRRARLVFVGSSTVPGVGVPMVLVSDLAAARVRDGPAVGTLEDSYASAGG